MVCFASVVSTDGVSVKQEPLFDDIEDYPTNIYRQKLTVTVNNKGVLDVDTVKGCRLGMEAYPSGGCYGECYAYRIARRYGLDFTKSVSRKLFKSNKYDVFNITKNHGSKWYRVGVAGDPCHDWENTIEILQFLNRAEKSLL